MRTITITNYEEFIIDYIDGNLCAEETADLLLFVEQHPAIKAEFELLDSTPIAPPETIVYTNKNKLKKDTTYTNETIVGYMEHDLSPTETLAFEKELATNTRLQYELALFNKTILVADAKITYPHKRKLKKQNKVLWLWAYGAAASVVVAMLVYSVVNTSSHQVANNSVVAPINTTITDSNMTTITEVVTPITPNKFKKVQRKNSSTSTIVNKATLPVIKSNEVAIIKPEVDTTVIIPTAQIIAPIAYTLTENYAITTIRGQSVIATIKEANKYVSIKELAKQKINNLLTNKLGIKRKPNADGTLVAYEIAVGEFEFSRTVNTTK